MVKRQLPKKQKFAGSTPAFPTKFGFGYYRQPYNKSVKNENVLTLTKLMPGN
jgi:hypothetical protein